MFLHGRVDLSFRKLLLLFCVTESCRQADYWEGRRRGKQGEIATYLRASALRSLWVESIPETISRDCGEWTLLASMCQNPIQNTL
ncbi:hypothetical protein GGR51DRAFT_519399 [Nemania sp. FL0031]|nr:hypothetical protein GGR51DRAFT_519399 [Nemania sp. FL0031]